MKKENKISKTRSHGILLLVKVVPIFFVGLFALLPTFFPDYFPWIPNMGLYRIVLVVLVIFQTWVVIMTEYRGENSLYKNTSYVFILFYAVVIYLTGGVNSSFTFIMVFVPIVALSYLDEKLMKRIGIISVIFLASIIFFQKGAITDPVYIIKHFLNVSLYALMVYYIYGIMKEILHRKYEEEILKRKFIETNELNKAKSVFSTVMSHQLRTPLTGVRWAIEEAIRDKKTSKKMLEEGERRIINAIDILNGVLKTTEFDSVGSGFKINKKPVVLNSLIRKIVANLNFIVEIRGNKISYDMPEEIAIDGDEKMLELAFTNIIDNALKYSPNGLVKISLAGGEKSVKLIVEDSGIGIESADLEYVSQKFFRGKNAMLVDPNGSGIGLYTAKKIVEMHDGEVKISSGTGKGTKVVVNLPIS